MGGVSSISKVDEQDDVDWTEVEISKKINKVVESKTSQSSSVEWRNSMASSYVDEEEEDDEEEVVSEEQIEEVSEEAYEQ